MFPFGVCLTLWMGACGGFVNEISLEQLQIDFANMRTLISQLQQTVTSLQKQLNDTKRTVAFTAHLSKTVGNVGSHQHIVFDTIISNIGGAYSVRSGHFTAPVTGTYVFSLTLTNVPGKSTSLTIMKNGRDIAHGLAHGTDHADGQWETTTIPVVVALATGDEVWVQNEVSFTAVEELDGYNYSSFSGFLLNAS